MARELSCPKCGAFIDPPDENVRVCQCLICNETVVIPKAPSGSGAERSLMASRISSKDQPGDSKALRKKETEARYPWHVKVVATGAGIVVLALLTWALWPCDTWEQENLGRILSLCREGAALADQGQVPEAAEKYQEALALVGDRQLKSEVARAAISWAAVVQKEAQAVTLVRAGDYARAAVEYRTYLDLLQQQPATTRYIADAVERATRQMRLANVKQMEGSAESLAKAQEYERAIAQYDRLLAFLQEQPGTDPSVQGAKGRAEEARRSLAVKLVEMKAQEEQRHLAEAERARQATERQRQAEEQKRQQQKAARRRQIPEKLPQAEEAGRADASGQVARDQFLKSPLFAEIKTRAGLQVKMLDADPRTEDSAWRAISKSSEAAFELMVLLVHTEAGLAGQDVFESVSRIQQKARADLLLEDSALRAICKKDGALLDLLGVWCRLLEKDHPGLARSFADKWGTLASRLLLEDTAYGSQSACLNACTAVLRDILAAKGGAKQADGIVADTQTANLGDTSAIRAASRNAKACMELMLLLAEQRNKAAASDIRLEVLKHTAGDNSAVRAHYEYKRGLARAIHLLVTSAGGA